MAIVDLLWPVGDVGLPDVGHRVLQQCKRLSGRSGLCLGLKRQAHQHLDDLEGVLPTIPLRHVVEDTVQGQKLVDQHSLDLVHAATSASTGNGTVTLRISHSGATSLNVASRTIKTTRWKSRHHALNLPLTKLPIQRPNAQISCRRKRSVSFFC